MADVENKDEGLLYLLSAYHNLRVDCISKATIRQVNSCNIVERDLASATLKWNIPLYTGQNTDNVWDWVNEFRNKFRAANEERWGTKKTCVQRMKAWFAEHPQYRKEDVLQAVDLYLRVTSHQYIMKSHKFIYDGIGVMKNSTLLEWVEKYKEKEGINNTIDPNLKMM